MPTTRTFDTIAEAMAFQDGIELASKGTVFAQLDDADPWTVHIEDEPARSDEPTAADQPI